MREYRHEYKYRLDARQAEILLVRTAGVLRPDPHAEADGAYLVRSLYFDTLENACLRDNLSGTDPRSKFRIRCYGHGAERISLEKKSKCRGMTRKESCLLSREECENFLHGKIPALRGDISETKKRLFTELLLRNLFPVTIVSYRRFPFVYHPGNVRITFDRDITSSTDWKQFLDGSPVMRPVLSGDDCVLEVKWDELLPRHLKNLLALENLQWTAFSKYAMCRMYHL